MPQHIPLPIETGDEHGPAVFFATRLVSGNQRHGVSLRGHVTEGFAEATLTELIGAAEEFYRIVNVEWSQQKLHGPIMLVAQREDVGPHGASLASGAKQNLRSRCGYSIYHRRGCERFTTTTLIAVLKRVREN
jgi:hypothetical protein